MNNKIKTKKIILNKTGIILTFLIFILTIILVNLVSADVFSRSNVAISPSSGDINFPFVLDKEQCEAGQDFILQVSPLGCIPSVVRSDLLEEQNVPVFCPIVATKLNPLIDIETIRSMTFSFSGARSAEVSGIGYYPAAAALGKTGQVTQPVLNNLGYAVIVLKQQRNESAMPDSVAGNLTARITYDIKNAFGVGQAVFYLPEITNDDEWDNNFKRYSFWDGRGYLRADSVGDDKASISVYSDRETYGSAKTDKRKIATEIFGVGETSKEIFVPGFDYCLGSLQLKLNGLENPDTRVRLNINGDITEVKKDGKFLDKCTVKEIEKNGINEKIKIKCDEDERTNTFSLTISPRINLSIDGVSKDYGVGDWLYNKSDKESVYLGFVGTIDDSTLKTSLYIRLIALPAYKEKLSDEEISSVTSYDKNVKGSKFDKGFFGRGVDIVKSIFSKFGAEVKKIIEGSELDYLAFGATKEPKFGKSVSIVGFASAIDKDPSEFPSGFRKYYENATKDYDEVLKSYSDEKDPDTEQRTLGERALYEKIGLAWEALQKKTAKELCEEFEEKYPVSVAPEKCEEAHKLSSVEISSRDVVIDGTVYRISLDEIKEPSFDEYGATIFVTYPTEAGGGSVEINLTKNQFIYLDEKTNEFVQLVDVDENSIKIKGSLNSAGTKDETKKEEFESKTLKIGSPERFGSNYLFTLEKVNLKKLAKVSVIPNIKYTQTEASFPFKIGIEKRAIQLSPEKINQKIESLSNTIAKWRSISNKLETAVKVGKAACLVTGGYFTVKNFFANLKGEGIARQKVMGGWYDKCEQEIKTTKESLDSCLLKNNSKIEASVKEYAGIIEAQNEKFKQLEERITKKRFLGEDVVNTEELMKRYVNADYRNGINENIQGKFENNKIKIGNEDVDVFNITKLITANTTSITQAKSLELNSELLNSNNEVIKKIAESQIKADLGDVWVNAKNEVERKRISEEFGFPEVTIGSTKKLTNIAITHRTTFGEVKNNFNGGGGSIADNSYVHIFVDESDGKKYLLVLTNDFVIDKTYLIETGNILTGYATLDNQKNPLGLSVKYYDQSTYKNKYKNPEVRYYASGQYNGFPAIVPFDTDNGWYAATKSAIPILGAIQPYQDSGRASNFYLCNVGPNGREEFFSEIGDDICRGFVAQASQPPNFPGLGASEALNKRTKAEEALLEAQRAYKPGITQITLFGQTIPVGPPATGIPDIKCQDFMSPSDCNLLFNVCDPVVCPSSRCDLGGTYPVSDVIQSGIIGSLALCLPNFPEVKIPVCLSGIYAGLEAYLSVLDSYQKCLETSSETGQTIGICDELHSVYMCDFFWRQSLPLVKYAIPQVLGSILGMNVRGGGEYLGFQDAWKRAGDSVGFFTQYYAANSFQAFKARSAEEVGTEICRNWVSIVAPGSGELFDALVEPDVPAQFYGRFDEIPFTTATIPPISHYKVFYHIYAGKDLPAYYQVYLRGTGESFYRDVPTRRMVATGFIKTGEYATKTEDFTAPSGYNELCIVVNNKEECGFKQVTTEFGLNYMTEQYLKEQASEKDITTEATCVSGTPNILSLLSPNIQSGVEEGVNPAIYNRGITRICATANPGQGTDQYIETENQRWVDVGYCDSSKIRCWLDTNSVKDTIKITSIEEEILKDVQPNYVDALLKEGGYVENFDTLVSEIKAEKDETKKIELINNNLDKVFFNHEKGYLILLRADAYAWLAFMEKLPERIIEPTSEGGGIIEPTSEAEKCPVPDTTEEVSKLTEPRDKVLKTIEELDGQLAPGPACFNSIDFVYKSAGVEPKCYYSDRKGTTYFVGGKTITIGVDENEKGEQFFLIPTTGTTCEKPIGALGTYEQKLGYIQSGYWLDIVWADKSSHSVIFVKWVDKEKGIAQIFDWMAGEGKTYGYRDIYLTENIHPVYFYKNPISVA